MSTPTLTATLSERYREIDARIERHRREHEAAMRRIEREAIVTSLLTLAGTVLVLGVRYARKGR
jgi:hypothetical protein